MKFKTDGMGKILVNIGQFWLGHIAIKVMPSGSGGSLGYSYHFTNGIFVY